MLGAGQAPGAGQSHSSYGATLRIDRLVRHAFAYQLVTLDRHHAEDFAKFERYATAQPEILSCALLGSDFDYLLKAVAADVEHLRCISERLLAAKIGINKHSTHVVGKVVKDGNVITIERLLAASNLASLDRRP